MRRSITSNHDETGAATPFKVAAQATTAAWRKKHGYSVPCPPLSHALSIFEGNTWTVLDSELGEPVAVVVNNMAVLVEDLEDEQVA